MTVLFFLCYGMLTTHSILSVSPEPRRAGQPGPRSHEGFPMDTEEGALVSVAMRKLDEHAAAAVY